MSNTLFKWFTNNHLMANAYLLLMSYLLMNSTQEKSCLLMNSTQETQINIDGMAISNSKCEKLLGIHFYLFWHLSPLLDLSAKKPARN